MFAMRCDAMRYNAECGKCLDLQCNDAMRMRLLPKSMVDLTLMSMVRRRRRRRM